MVDAPLRDSLMTVANTVRLHRSKAQPLSTAQVVATFKEALGQWEAQFAEERRLDEEEELRKQQKTKIDQAQADQEARQTLFSFEKFGDLKAGDNFITLPYRLADDSFKGEFLLQTKLSSSIDTDKDNVVDGDGDGWQLTDDQRVIKVIFKS